MSLKNYQELILSIQEKRAPRRVALAAAEDSHSLEAIFLAAREGIAAPVLVGKTAKIEEILDSLKVGSAQYTIVGVEDGEDPAKAAVQMIRSGRADILMKGKLETANLLKAVVDKTDGINSGQMMSHLAVLELPGYHKLLAITDGGMVLSPDLRQKQSIIENAAKTLIKMGCTEPKIAVLAGVETVNPKMPETLDAAELVRLNKEGKLQGCLIEGPISYDLAMSPESARIKGYTGKYCGDFDVLVVPSMTTGNILSKALIYNAGAKMAGLVVGAEVPIVLTSRGATTEEKYLSLVLASAVG
jgi:phosphate butyryltransferase